MVGRRLACGAGPDHQPPGGTPAAVDHGSVVDHAAILASNLASGNVTGNDWADSRRRGRLAELVKEFDMKTGNLAATGYPKYVNQR